MAAAPSSRHPRFIRRAPCAAKTVTRRI